MSANLGQCCLVISSHPPNPTRLQIGTVLLASTLPPETSLALITVTFCVALSLCCDLTSLAVGFRFCWCSLTWEPWSSFYSTFSSDKWVQLTRRPSEWLVSSMMWIVYCFSLVWRDFPFWYVSVTEWIAFNECVRALVRDRVFLWRLRKPSCACVRDSEYHFAPLPIGNLTDFFCNSCRLCRIYV